MYNKPRGRLTLTRETNLHTTNSLASLQIVPTVSGSNSQNTVFSRHTQQFDKSTVQPQEQVIFRPTQILPSDVNMKRFGHQGPPDFTLNQFAEKVPIHFRSNKKQIVPASACAHDLTAPPDIVQDVEESGRSSRSSSHLSPNTQKAPAYLPGDRVIFAESPSAPGIPVVYRTPEERSSNPDRLNLDRRKLSICPILEGEEQLRLLNYQHNMISKIQHLSALKRLIFLDLYDNQIEEISGLNSLKSLRVLMLGKNRIKKIENLSNLSKLDVLDLHGNQISNIENLNHLSELRVLNLAGNHIVHVDNLGGMDSLAELNLRRNKIKTVVDVENLPSLLRLFLSFNDISSFEDIACLGESTSLTEISLDGNPIAQEQYYKQIVLRHMQNLKQLDMKRVTDTSFSRSSQTVNPYYQFMSGLRYSLSKSGILSQPDMMNTNRPSPRLPYGPLVSGASLSTDGINLDSDEIADRKRLTSGKPRFLNVKATNWNVNTEIPKPSSVSETIPQASQHRQAFLPNKANSSSLGALPLLRSRSSAADFRPSRPLNLNKGDNSSDPLCTSPLFTLSPTEGQDGKDARFSTSKSVDEGKLKDKKDPLTVSENDNSKNGMDNEHFDRRIIKNFCVDDKELKGMNNKVGSNSGLNGNMDNSMPEKATDKLDRKQCFNESKTKQLKEAAKKLFSGNGGKIYPLIEKNQAEGKIDVSSNSLKNYDDNDMIDTKNKNIVENFDENVNRETKDFMENNETNLQDSRNKLSENREEQKILTDIGVTKFDKPSNKNNSKPSIKNQKKKIPDENKSSDTKAVTRPVSEHGFVRQKPAFQTSKAENVERPVSEHSGSIKRSLTESFLQGVNLFRKAPKTAGGRNEFKQDEGDVKEGEEKQVKCWKIIDNKVVKITCSEVEIETELNRQKDCISKQNQQDIKPLDDKDLTGSISTYYETGQSIETMINCSKQSNGNSPDLQKETTFLSTNEYDVSITRNFYQKSSGVDQIMMIIPKTPSDTERKTSESKNDSCKEKGEGNDNSSPKSDKNVEDNTNLDTRIGQSTSSPPLSDPSKTLIDKTLKRIEGNHENKGQYAANKSANGTFQLGQFQLNPDNKKYIKMSHSLPDLRKHDVRKSNFNTAKSVVGKYLEEKLKRPDSLTIFKEPPIQNKPVMQTIPESEQIMSSAPDGQSKVNSEKGRLPKSLSAPSLSTLNSPGTSLETFNLSQSASPTSPVTPGRAESATPTRKNSGTTMGQSVVKKANKNTPLMLTCSAVLPVVTPREEEKRIALVMARKEEEKKTNMNKTQIMKEKKRLAINNARRQWEVMQGNMINKTGKLSRTPDLYANHVGSVPNSDLISPDGADENLEVESIHRRSRLRRSQSDDELSEKQSSVGSSRPGSSQSSVNVDMPDRPRTASRKPDSGKGPIKETFTFSNGDSRSGSDLNNLADLEGDTLTLYGSQSLEAFDKNWSMQVSSAVTHIIFKFMDFEEIVKHLYKIRTKFPGVQTLTFSATNIRSYQQINALSSVRRFDNLVIENEGNPITKFTLWRSYVIFRLAHFALKKINDMEVTAGDIVNAEKLYGPVSHITTSQLPQSRLLSLVGDARRKQVLSITEDKSKKLLEGKIDKSQNDFVGRAGLIHNNSETVSQKQQEQNARRNFARAYVNEITKEAIFTDRKRNELLKQWPLMFHEMVYTAVTDMSDMQGYMKKCLEEIEKS